MPLPPKAKPIDKEALMARVRGQTQTVPPSLRVPPPARPMPGIKGSPPLPQGKVVQFRTAEHLTSLERQTLEGYGWDADVPLPSNAAEVLQQFRDVQAEMIAEGDVANLPFPVDPGKPPLRIADIPVDQLNDSHKQLFRAMLQQAHDSEVESRENEATRTQMSTLGMGAQASYDMVRAQADRDLAAVEAATKADPKAPDPDEAKWAAKGIPQPPDEPPKPERPPEPPPVSDTGAQPTLHLCPHCNYNLSMPAIPEPPYDIKMAFLHAMLGEQCFTHEVDLMGGNVRVVFRTLTTSELDALHAQAYRDQTAGRIKTEIDFWERINRYRMFLQLVELRALASPGIQHTLPPGLSPETNTIARFHWSTSCDEPEPGETIIPEIEQRIVAHVLKTENLFRVVNSACNQFNRMASKLEANVNNADFWQPTAVQS